MPGWNAYSLLMSEQAAYFSQLHGLPDAELLIAMMARYGVLPVDGPPLEKHRGADTFVGR